jgi:hypothetical protein
MPESGPANHVSRLVGYDENIVGVELLVDIPNKTIQFYSITSSVKGYGEKIVSSVVNSLSIRLAPKKSICCDFRI